MLHIANGQFLCDDNYGSDDDEKGYQLLLLMDYGWLCGLIFLYFPMLFRITMLVVHLRNYEMVRAEVSFMIVNWSVSSFALLI